MIDEAMAGKIDMIVTKYISRFARNTLDCLKYIRQLKEKNIPVYFEKENICGDTI
jgi:site-specific DNA recombinase